MTDQSFEAPGSAPPDWPRSSSSSSSTLLHYTEDIPHYPPSSIPRLACNPSNLSRARRGFSRNARGTSRRDCQQETKAPVVEELAHLISGIQGKVFLVQGVKKEIDWEKISMASSEVDVKFLAQFAYNIQADHPLLAQSLFQILGNLTMLADKVIRARKLRRLDTTRDTKSVDLYCRIIWYAREGLKILEEYVLPMVANYGELKVLSYKLRASYYHLYVLFHNDPPVSLKAQISTPPGLKSPRNKLDKGKGVDRGSPSELVRPSSVQPTHPLEGGPVGGVDAVEQPPPDFAPNFLVPAEDYRPIALRCFQEATALAERHLWGSHPLRLSVKVEFSAFLYDCLHERERSRQLAKATIAEVYNAQEGMDDEMFEDAASLVGILGKMMKRGMGAGPSSSTPGNSATPTPQLAASQAPALPAKYTPPRAKPTRRPPPTTQSAIPSPGMDNAI